MATQIQSVPGQMLRLARASFLTTLVSLIIDVGVLIANIYIYLVSKPPLRLVAPYDRVMEASAVSGVVLAVIAVFLGVLLRRQSKAVAAQEQKREKPANIADTITQNLQQLPQQIARARSGQGCSIALTVPVLGVSVALLVITFAPLAGASTRTFHIQGHMKSYALSSGFLALSIVPGKDGALWFTEEKGFQGASTNGVTSKIGRISVSGALTEVPLAPNYLPVAIVAGPDGALWFTELNDASGITGKIGRLTPNGALKEYPVPYAFSGLTVGPDGALWFATLNGIGRITTAGSYKEFKLNESGPAENITTGPDGALWFTEAASGVIDKIGRLTTSGALKEYPLTKGYAEMSSLANDIVTGSDGALWVGEGTQTTGAIGRLTTAGKITNFPLANGYFPASLVAGPDGAIWFSETNNTSGKIGRISTTGQLTEYPIAGGGMAGGITIGPDNTIWFAGGTLAAGAIGQLS